MKWQLMTNSETGIWYLLSFAKGKNPPLEVGEVFTSSEIFEHLKDAERAQYVFSKNYKKEE